MAGLAHFHVCGLEAAFDHGNRHLILEEQDSRVGMNAKGEEEMRRYEDGQERKLKGAVCNKCGRELKVENGYLREFCFSGKAAFGYFSRRDGAVQRFDLCEDCYDEWTAQFAVPAEETAETELV